MVSGGIAALISCPAEVTLVRISNDSTLPVEMRRNYKGVADAFQRILKEEGDFINTYTDTITSTSTSTPTSTHTHVRTHIQVPHIEQ